VDIEKNWESIFISPPSKTFDEIWLVLNLFRGFWTIVSLMSLISNLRWNEG